MKLLHSLVFLLAILVSVSAHSYSAPFKNLHATGLLAASSSISSPSNLSFPHMELNTTMNIMAEILSRGQLWCGVSSNPLYGFSNLTISGNETGLEVSLCMAYAAALGVQPVYVPITSFTDRFIFLNNRSVDVVLFQATATITRELTLNATFATPYMHDGAGILALDSVLASSSFSIGSLNGSTMCVVANSSTIVPLQNLLQKNNINVTMVIINNQNDSVGAMASGKCSYFALDQSSLVTTKALLQLQNIGSTIVTDVQLPFSNEPLSPVTLSGDENWAFFVNWITQSLFIAEANNVTKASLVSGNANLVGEAARLVGGDSTVVPPLLQLGQAVSRAVSKVGNFGEIYNATFSPYIPRNKLDIPTALGGCFSYIPFE